MVEPSADHRLPPGQGGRAVLVRPTLLEDAAAVAGLLNKLAEKAHADHPVTTARVETYLRHCESHTDMYVNYVAETAASADEDGIARGDGTGGGDGILGGSRHGADAAAIRLTVIGFLSAVFYETPFHDKGTCLINELIVDADRRGAGVGRALVETAKAEARRRGMDEIEVGTEKTNLAAQRFYQRVGFDEEFVLLSQDFHKQEEP